MILSRFTLKNSVGMSCLLFVAKFLTIAGLNLSLSWIVVFWGDQQCENWVSVQGFGDRVCHSHHDLMWYVTGIPVVFINTVSETLDTNLDLTWLTVREDFKVLRSQKLEILFNYYEDPRYVLHDSKFHSCACVTHLSSGCCLCIGSLGRKFKFFKLWISGDVFYRL